MGRNLKQVVYGGAFVLFVGVLVLIIYFAFIRVTPTCFDGVKNQNETGIDCGGVCTKVCFPDQFRAIEQVGSLSILKIDENHLSLLAEIQNPNQGYAAKYFDYSFNLFDVDGNLLKTISGQSYIYAGEIKYLPIPNLNIKPTDVSSAELKIENPTWVEEGKFPKPKLRVQNQNLGFSNNQFEISGSLINDDPANLENVEVLAIFFSAPQKPAAVSVTRLSKLNSGETSQFPLIRHPLINGVMPQLTQVFASAFRP